MKKIITLLLLCVVFSLNAETFRQFAYVKTKGSKEKVGDRINGVKIYVRNGGAYETDARGEVVLEGLDEKFILNRVHKSEFELLDYEIVGSTFDITEEPLRIVMVSQKQLKEEIAGFLKELQAAFEKEKNKSTQLQLDMSKMQKSMEAMAERLARVDYDVMDAKDREIHECMERGDYAKADSLILTKGTIAARREYKNKGDKSLIEDCYLLATNALIRNDVDSSLVLLSIRADMAPTDERCLMDAGLAYLEYKTDIEKAVEYFEQAYFFSKKKYGIRHEMTIEAKLNICLAYMYERKFSEMMPIIQDCLNVYKIKNIPNISDYDNFGDLVSSEEDVFGNQYFSQKDSILINQIYSAASIALGVLGNYNMSIKCLEESSKYSNNEDSEFMQWLSYTSLLISAGQYRFALDQFIIPLLEVTKNEQMDPLLAEINLFAGLSYLELADCDSTIVYMDRVINYYAENGQKCNQYYILASLYKSTALIWKECYNEANEIFKLVETNRGCIPSDLQIRFKINKGLSALCNKDYDMAETILFEALVESDLTVEYDQAKGGIFLYLAQLYKEKESLDEAYNMVIHAFNCFTKLFEQIEYQHPYMYATVEEMFDIELMQGLYYEAFQTLEWRYCWLEKDESIKRMEYCYEKASEDKIYRKSSNYKKMKKEYKEFFNKLEKR